MAFSSVTTFARDVLKELDVPGLEAIQPKILIAGAGIGGLSTALCLHAAVRFLVVCIASV